MKVSVITPYYQGREYLDRYCGMMEQNRSRLEPGDELEVLLINDSPWEKVVLPGANVFPGSEFWKMRKTGAYTPPGWQDLPARSESPFCFWIRTMSWRRRPSAA